ncbi:HAD-IC family P-type ATPase [Clostridium sp.]|uniref:HAD-IC family P-type ATPase n=1 Tax=Clostridium sp. TaxID=1506 RepID=UPI00346463C7
MSYRDLQEDDENREHIYGLTEEEVRSRVKNGEVNILPKAPARTMGEIIRVNLFTRFNAINFVLAILVIIAGSPKNALFAGVIITNTIVGVVQEIRAKRTLEKLSVLNMAETKVLREGKEKSINVEEVVLDDIIVLTPGSEVVVDGEVLPGSSFEVDESMLTGEADPVFKEDKSTLLSGSFVVSGSGYGRVTHVGKDTYAAKLSDEARKFKKINSELAQAVDKILKVLIWLIFPIGALLVISQIFFTDRTWQEAIISATAGIIGMVPEGLVLLTSLTFVVGVVRLSKWNTLVQELPATEVLARVDVLCLDKTGTITEGALKLHDIKLLQDYKEEDIDKVLCGLAHAFPSTNPTQQAILDKYSEKSDLVVKSTIPFSSDKKWSGAKFKEYGSWVLGAPEMVLRDRYDNIKNDVEEEAKKGRRVLILAKLDGSLEEELPENVEGIALLLIEDIIRKEAPSTLEYFHREGVNVKIISGDNPVTVAAVAKRAGVKNSENYIDARTLPEDEKGLEKVAENTTVFGRVTPHQKKELVKALQRKGHIVAMTGDGVNDVLALKEADCGISMANASDATKAVAQLVLLDSNFASLPEVVVEGRRMINNLESVSDLYLTKTVYSILLSLIFGVILLPYPILPIQLSLIGAVAIGIPSFFLALGPNKERVKSGYLNRVLSTSITNGVIITGATIIIFMLSSIHKLTIIEARTLSTIVVGGISIMVLKRVAQPLNLLKTGLVIAMGGLFALAYVFPIGRMIFSFVIPKDIIYILIAVLLVLVSEQLTTIALVIYESVIDRFNKKKQEKKEKINH